MSLARHLTPEEEVISQSQQFYATSSRVIRYEQKEGGEEDVRSLPYSLVETVELVSKPKHHLMILGTVMAILALPLFFYLRFSSIIILLAGIGLVIYGGIEREAYYQLKVRNMTEDEAKLWRIPREGGGQLVATVRQMIGDTLEF